MPAERIVEVKRQLDGREQRFDCELVSREHSLIVVLFRMDRPPWGDAARPLLSYGFFWPRRPYNCYYIVPPGQRLPRVVRFDVVREVDISGDRNEVRYTDLLLDLRIDGDGARWEDEEAVVAARDGGLLSGDDLARIARARRVLEHGHRRIAAEARQRLRLLGVLS